MAKRSEAELKVSRRSFLSSAAAGVAGGAVAEFAGNTPAVANISAQAPIIQELRTDVVAVGSGIGGLTAALRAQKAGARVIVLEKASEPGGTTFHSGGAVHHPTYEEMRANVPEGDPDVQRTVAENIDKWDAFMEAINAPLGTQGRTGLRMIAPAVWVEFMVRMIESAGGKILLETPMTRLLTGGQNEIIGVLADGPRGVIRIFARAVVLATGGWMTNAEMVQQNITRYFGSLRQRNVSFGGRTPFLGDGLFAALRLGAQPSTGGFDSFYGHLMVARPGKITEPMTELSATFAPWGVAVNKFGRRFTDEAQGKLSGRLMTFHGEELCVQEVARQPDAMAAYVCDDVVYRRYACNNCTLGAFGTYIQFKMAGAPTAMANTLPDLARQMEDWRVGISAEAVLHDITEYNRAAKNGKAWALPVPKTSTKHALALEQPPFYAVLGQAGITATHGGIRVNALGQVLHRSGKPIPGLFAAGVDIGNFNNCAYLGNLNLGAAYGYVSGENAAKQSAPQRR
jgi:succinate dehydrogenase/fumarate reductase flavoprotein subunit